MNYFHSFSMKTVILLFDGELKLIDSPEDFLTAHEQSIEGMTALAIDSGRYVELRSGLYQEKKQGTKTHFNHR